MVFWAFLKVKKKKKKKYWILKTYEIFPGRGKTRPRYKTRLRQPDRWRNGSILQTENSSRKIFFQNRVRNKIRICYSTYSTALLKESRSTRERASPCSVSSLGVRTRKTRYLICPKVLRLFPCCFSEKTLLYVLSRRVWCFQYENLPVCNSSNVNTGTVCSGVTDYNAMCLHNNIHKTYAFLLETSPVTSRLSLKPRGARALSAMCVVYVNYSTVCVRRSLTNNYSVCNIV